MIADEQEDQICSVHPDVDQNDCFEKKMLSQAGHKDSFEKQIASKAGHDLSWPQSHKRDTLFWISSIPHRGPGRLGRNKNTEFLDHSFFLK